MKMKNNVGYKESDMAVNSSVKILWAGIVMSVLLLGAVSVFAFSMGKYEKIKSAGDVVTIPVTKLTDGKAHFFKFEDSGKEINFFAVKAADGSYKIAFDACDSCFRSKKGYEQQGEKMNCKNCNQKFAINRLGPNATGGCNPGYLPHQQVGSNITIKAADLKDGARYF